MKQFTCMSEHAGSLRVSGWRHRSDSLPCGKSCSSRSTFSICAELRRCAVSVRNPTAASKSARSPRLRAIERSEFLRQHYPVLTEAAATVASPVLRNMGTIGGNICLDTRCLWYNQSLTWRKGCGFCIKKDGDLCHVAPGGTKCWAVFSGDTPPALLCLDAEIEIAGANGTRRIPLRDFYTGLGDNYRKLQPNELVTRIFLPAESAGYRGVYRKLRVRGSIDYPLAGVAVVMKRSRMAMVSAMSPTPASASPP